MAACQIAVFFSVKLTEKRPKFKDYPRNSEEIPQKSKEVFPNFKKAEKK
jgi:hypothetical protein